MHTTIYPKLPLLPDYLTTLVAVDNGDGDGCAAASLPEPFAAITGIYVAVILICCNAANVLDLTSRDMRNSLKTQDRLNQWDVGANTDLTQLRCPLCDGQPDSHAHLFFECPFSTKVWYYVRDLAGMDNVPPFLHDIILYLQPICKKRSALSIFGKLIIAASSYFIWIERNNRLFKKGKKSPEEVRDMIMVTVRLKLINFCFKQTDMVTRLLSRWKIPNHFRIYV
ncbi:reverse transcriptase zinc-binding domain-containing protein [Tanacetum coccineum]